MSAQTVSATSLICLERGRRAAAMRATGSAGHATEFLYGMHAPATGGTEEALGKGQLRLLPPRELCLCCLSGQVWLTRDGDTEDYILGPGQLLAVGRDDRAAVQALRDSRIRLVER